MARCQNCVARLVFAVFCAAVVQDGMARSEDFRVDNAVYAGDQKEPSSESVTIFYDGVVYDFLKAPAETVVFQKTAGRFILLNRTHRKRTELSMADVTMFVTKLRPIAADSKDPVVKFLAEPKFQTTMDDTAGELSMGSSLVNYRLKLAPESSTAVVEQYRDFCDWYARLNTLLVPGSRPPFGRLAVNATLAEHQALASQVVLSITTGKEKRQTATIRSEHRVVRPLSPADIEQVTQTREFLTSFKLVDFKHYRKIEPH